MFFIQNLNFVQTLIPGDVLAECGSASGSKLFINAEPEVHKNYFIYFVFKNMLRSVILF
jgi:hypothetical protein